MREPAAQGESGEALLALYDEALPAVYGYLFARCRQRQIAEDLTAETFLAAVGAVRRDSVDDLTIGWMVGVARHKLADHWRRSAREEAKVRALQESGDTLDDPWDVELDRLMAEKTLAKLGSLHRLVLTLRYVDDLPVAATAEILGRSIHATEALLTRAKASFRRAYAAPTSTTTSTPSKGGLP